MKEKPDLSTVFDILLEKWSRYLSSVDIVIIVYVINSIIKDDYKILRKSTNEISLGCGVSFPSIFRALEKASVFQILDVKHDEKINRIFFGRKLRNEIDKKMV